MTAAVITPIAAAVRQVTVRLRPYQQQVKAQVQHAWLLRPMSAICLVMATGGGKTATVASIVLDNPGPVCCIAHRDSLITQMSMALARNGVRHRIIGDPATAAEARREQIQELGLHFVDPQARVAVAGVQSLVGKKYRRLLHDWFPTVTLVVVDEGHHLLRDNIWGRACALFTNARILAPTATPQRADGKGLGRHADGLLDEMIQGPSTAELIEMGYLVPIRIFCPPGSFDRNALVVGAQGEYTEASTRAAVRNSQIVGDVPHHFAKLGGQVIGMTFAPDRDTAREMAERFKDAGVPAAMLDGETDPKHRFDSLKAFARRETRNITSVALFGEGTDIPNLDVVSDAAPTNSLSSFLQRVGRLTRVSVSRELAARWDEFTNEERRAHIAASEKPYGYYYDHVRNVHHHGLPTAPRQWTLDRRERRGSNKPSDVMPTTDCAECAATYERIHPACPYCGAVPVPVSRKGPQFVDGDLYEVDPEVIRQMEQAIDHAPRIPQGASPAIQGRLERDHWEKMRARRALQDVVDLWAGWRKHEGDTPQMAMRRFWHTFGMDVLTAKGLNRADSDKLQCAILGVLTKASITSTLDPQS